MIKLLLIAFAVVVVVSALIVLLLKIIIKRADQAEQLKEQAREVKKLKFLANRVNNKY